MKELSLDDIVGLDEHKKKLYNNLFLPVKEKELYSKLVKCPEKVKVRKHFLFYGPPGTGKTSLAKAMAFDYDVPFVFVQGTQFLNQFVGVGAEAMRNLYSNQKGIVFIDEIDVIAKKRNETNSNKTDDVLVQLLLILDSATSDQNTTTIMATNKYDFLDDALISRIPKHNQLYFALPDYEQRENMIIKQLSYYNHKIDAVDLLVNKSDGYDGRDIEDLFSNARSSALSAGRDYLLLNDFGD